MILPERVLGRPGANWITSGRAIGLISCETNFFSSSFNAGVVTPVGSGLGIDLSDQAGFDVFGPTQTAFLSSLNPLNNQTSFYSLDLSTGADELMPRLAALGGRVRPLRAGTLEMGEAMFLPAVEGPTTLADREKQAIVRTLDVHEWRLAETAKALGISRTTLWRRLRAYGLHRDGRTKWSPTSSPSV